MKPKRESLADTTRRRLMASGEKQEIIAAQCGIGQATVSRLLRGEGRPSLDTIESVALWLDKRDKKAARRAARASGKPPTGAAVARRGQDHPSSPAISMT